MLPFHKRPRNPSEIEIQPDELEPLRLPAVRPPSSWSAPLSSRPAPLSSRPAPVSSPALARPSRPALSFASYGDDEQTVHMQRPASAPPRATLDLRVPRMPANFPPPCFDDEPATQIRAGHTVLAMSTPTVVVEESGRHEVTAPASHRMLPDQTSAQRAVAAEAPKSAAAVDMSMTIGGSIAPPPAGRPAPIWAAALLAVGVFGGLVTAVLARGDGASSMASLVDPSHVTADIQPAAALPGVAAGAAAPVSHPVASCADAVPQPVVKVVTRAPAPAVEDEGTRVAISDDSTADDAVPARVAASPRAPVAHKVVVAIHKPVAAAARPVAHVTHPAVATTHYAAPKPAHHVTSKHSSGGDEMDSASAADALAKAQLEASLGR